MFNQQKSEVLKMKDWESRFDDDDDQGDGEEEDEESY